MPKDIIQPATTHIQPNPKLGLNLGQIWHQRELLGFFMWRNFKIRYKQTVIGAGWALFRPLVLMVVFTLFFHRAVGIGTGDDQIPYPIFSYVGLLFWTYFAQTVTSVGTSLVDNQNIFKKVFFPRLIMPLAASLTGLIDFAVATLIYIALAINYGIYPSLAGLLLFVPMLLVSIAAVLGVGSFMAALNVRYRDVSQALPFMIQVLLFLSPVIYPVSIVPETWRWLIFLNPIAGVIEVMRATLLGIGSIDLGHLAISLASCLILLIAGIRFFKRQEKIFADYV